MTARCPSKAKALAQKAVTLKLEPCFAERMQVYKIQRKKQKYYMKEKRPGQSSAKMVEKESTAS